LVERGLELLPNRLSFAHFLATAASNIFPQVCVATWIYEQNWKLLQNLETNKQNVCRNNETNNIIGQKKLCVDWIKFFR
jgi:hypothetical protein